MGKRGVMWGSGGDQVDVVRVAGEAAEVFDGGMGGGEGGEALPAFVTGRLGGPSQRRLPAVIAAPVVRAVGPT